MRIRFVLSPIGSDIHYVPLDSVPKCPNLSCICPFQSRSCPDNSYKWLVHADKNHTIECILRDQTFSAA